MSDQVIPAVVDRRGPVPLSAAATEAALRDAAVASAEAGGRPLASRRPVRLALGLALPAALLVAWQLTTSLGWFTVVQLPSPLMVAQAAVDLFERGLLVKYLAISTQRVVAGFAIGASLGLLFGALTGLSATWDRVFGPTLGAIRAVPSLAWVPLLLLWLKLGEESKVTLIAIGAFFPVCTTVSLALRHVDRQLVEAGRAFGLSGVRLLTAIQLPAILPSVISGMRLALAQSWLFLVAAELIASSAGLGFLLTDSQNNGRVDRILLAIVLLAVIGKATDSILGVAERRALRRWA
ncbi:MAG: ABC transporter permease [Chloroflexota bacterium]